VRLLKETNVNLMRDHWLESHAIANAKGMKKQFYTAL
jgi:hypothetical protein